MRRWRVVVLSLVPVLAWAVPPPAASGGESATETVTVAEDPAEAAALARRNRAPVEVLSLGTEREKRFANPDGTWTVEQHAVPIRVRQGTGWVPLDTTLTAAGPHLTPRATAVDLRFSAGGSGPLVTIGRGSRRLSLTLPWPLPAPVIDGPRARYSQVLPGVDLVLTAQPEGFSKLLVVRDRAAAANPALDRLRFAVTAAGLAVRAQEGGFAAVDGAGATVFTSPAPAMWDSAGGTNRAAQDWPTQGDRRVTMPASVAGEEIVVTPDRALLDDPSSVYPVYLDPAVTGARNEWAMISSGYPNDRYYKFSGDEGVGLCDLQTESSCNRDQIKRLAWEFGVSTAVHGSRVLNATFKAYETHAWDCTADGVALWLVSGLSSGTTWNNHVWDRQLHSVSTARKPGCPNGPGWVEFNATSAAADFAARRWPSLTLGLKATNEGSMPGGWKRFRNDAALSITYNSPPRVPTNLSADGAGCATGTGRPVISSATPMLRAVVSDPDGDETDLRAAFAWERWDGAAWVAMGSAQQPNLRTGAAAQVQIGTGLAHAGRYRWHVQAQDPYSFNGVSGVDSSTFTDWCEFEVDTVGPAVAPGVSSTLYGSDINQTYGSVGLTGDFTFTASGVTDVAGYKWGWNTPLTTTVNAPTVGGAVTVPLTPPPATPDDPTSGGLLTLFVASVDRSGRTGPVREYPFKVGSASGPVGVWEMAESPGATSLADTNQRGALHHATLTSATPGVSGRLLGSPAKPGPGSVRFNGSTSTAATSGPVVNTSRSFTVSAWVRLNSATATFQTAVGQLGANTSAFFLQYNTGRWSFTTHNTDVANSAGGLAATTVSAAQVATWTHLTGVYDAQGSQLRLYVNGTLAATATRPGVWDATGPLTIGHVRAGGAVTNLWNGDIAEVRVWDRVLSGPEISPMSATLVGRWRLDGDGTDSTPYARTAIPAAGVVTWTDDRHGTPDGAAAFAQGQTWLETPGPVVRTNHSYTVAAWVRSADTGNYQTILCQFGVGRCSFYLQYSLPHDRWVIIQPSNDGTPVSAYYAATSTAPPAYDDWVHLTGVYDASRSTLRFYLNGVQQGILTGVPQSWHANGPLRIGFMDSGGVNGVVDGAVDDVRVYAGVLNPTEIMRICSC